MASETESRIVSTPEVLDGAPRIRGRRLSVSFIHAQVDGRGLDPHEVADQYELDIADVYRALAYYHENSAEMAAIQARRDQLHADAREDPEIVTGPKDLENTRKEGE